MSEKKKKRRHTGSSKAAKAEFYARFVKAFFAERENVTRAYLAVKPHVKENSAASEGHKLLKVPEIQQAIAAEREAIRERYALRADRVIQELTRVAYFNAQRTIGPDGKMKKLHEIDEDTAAGLQVEFDGKGKVVRVRTPALGAKNTAVRQAVKITRLEDRPPPPPADPVEGAQVDQRDVARRMAFLLEKEAHTKEREGKPAPKAVRKKISVPA